jgi:hypothetical protein
MALPFGLCLLDGREQNEYRETLPVIAYSAQD